MVNPLGRLLGRARIGTSAPDGRMTLAEHLYELRARLIVSLAALAVGVVLAWVFFPPVFHLLTRPYCRLPAAHRLGGGHCTLVVTGLLDAFNVRLRLSLYTGLVLSSPVWLWQLWRFVTPGLYRNERRWTLTFVASSLVLFAVGAGAAYLTLSKGLRFLLGVAGADITPLIRVDSYLSFLVSMVLVFGVSFEFPLLVVLLNLVGVVSYARLRSWRRMEIFLVFLFAGVVTPSQDPFTMSALAVPMCLLYEVALLVARAHDRAAGRRAQQSPYARLSDDEASPLQMGSL